VEDDTQPSASGDHRLHLQELCWNLDRPAAAAAAPNHRHQDDTGRLPFIITDEDHDTNTHHDLHAGAHSSDLYYYNSDAAVGVPPLLAAASDAVVGNSDAAVGIPPGTTLHTVPPRPGGALDVAFLTLRETFMLQHGDQHPDAETVMENLEMLESKLRMFARLRDFNYRRGGDHDGDV